MKILKNTALVICGFVITLVSSIYLWYNYPDVNLSFLLNGNGNPYLDFNYTDYDNKQYSDLLSPQLNSVAQKYEVKLRSFAVQDLDVTIKNYEGNLEIFDISINGNTIIPSIEGQDSKNLTINVQEKANFTLCKNCYKPLYKIIKLKILAIIGILYILICIAFFLSCRIKDKLKEKMLKVYTLRNYALIFPYAKPYLGRALLAILITAPIGMMDAVIAWSLKPFMDVVLVEKQASWTMYIPLMIIVFSVLQALFTYLATYMNTWVGNKIALDIKRKLYTELLHRDAAFFDMVDSGFIIFRYSMDAEHSTAGLLNSMRLFSTRFFSSISLIGVLLYNSWQLALVAIIFLFGALLPLTKIRKQMKKIVAKDANIMGLIIKEINEAYNGNRIISAYNLFKNRKTKFQYTTDEQMSIIIQRLRKVGIISPIIHVISSLGIAFVIWYGSYLIMSHQITIGNFASFITSLVMLYNPLKSIGNNVDGIIMSLMAVERVFQQLNFKNNIKNAEDACQLENCHGNIRYENVSFGYTPDKQVLKSINLDIKAGETIALVGNSGGGKTTISSLLPRFYDVTKGAIKIDGIDIRKIDLKSLRDNIAIVFQDNFLFGGSIRDNIVLGRSDVSEERLQQVLKSACLDEFISTLENGVDTQIGERGVLLSGGQRQRVAIARAFIKDAPILILDEATSALDNKSEKVVQQAIENLMKERTVLVIAHRLSTVCNADKIVVINDGKIVEQGKHEELLQQEGYYAALYKTQLS